MFHVLNFPLEILLILTYDLGFIDHREISMAIGAR
jgi:hypothetical protein